MHTYTTLDVIERSPSKYGSMRMLLLSGKSIITIGILQLLDVDVGVCVAEVCYYLIVA